MAGEEKSGSEEVVAQHHFQEEQAQQIASLEAELRMLRRIFDILPDHIYVKNTQSQFVYANQPVVHNCGCERIDQILGKTDFDFFPHDLAAQYYAYEQELMRTGIPLLNHEEQNQFPNGKRGWLLSTKIPLKDNKGVVIGLAGVNRDITERKDIEEEKQHLLNQYKEALDSLKQMQGQVLTVCAWTKQIKEQDRWISLEEFLEKHFHIGVSHGISQDAINQLRTHLNSPSAPPPAC